MNEIETVCAAIDRLGKKLARDSDLERLNALLSLASPEHVLPSPAVGLMEISTTGTVRIESGAYLRSVEPVGPIGEVTLTPINAQVVVQPWRLRSSKFVILDGTTRGVELDLERRTLDSPGDGWLSIMAEGPPELEWAFRTSRVSCDGARCETRSQEATLSQMSGNNARASRFMRLLSHRIIAVKLPVEDSSESGCKLRLDFSEALEGEAWDSVSTFRINVIPVWNSLPATYPSFERAEANLSGAINRLVHPLTTESLGGAWAAWAVERVGSSRDARLVLDDRGPNPEFKLAVVPAGSAAGHKGPYSRTPGVVLATAGAQRLELAGARLSIEFVATTGSKANGVPEGAKFRLVESSGLPQRERIEGVLACPTLGGSDGMLGTAEAQTLNAIMPSASPRTVGEVLNFLRHEFGEMLDIVDPLDLIRHHNNGQLTELMVRVVVNSRYSGRASKRAVLAACQQSVEDYLSTGEIGEIRFQEYQP